MSINWDDPACRLALIERVGAEEYSRLFAEHQRRRVVAKYGGHDIYPVRSLRYGQLYAVGRTGRAFQTMREASAYASKHPVMEAANDA